MPNRKKSYISRKLPPVARSTAPIFDCGAAESGREAEVVAASMRRSLEKARSDVVRLFSYMTSGPGDGKRENGRRRGAGLCEAGAPSQLWIAACVGGPSSTISGVVFGRRP